MWKKILKIDMEEARRLGDRYAPADMEEARQEKLNTLLTKVKPTIEKILEMYIEMPEFEADIRRLRDSIVSLMKGLPNAPRLSRKTDIDSRLANKAMIEDYFANFKENYKR